MAKWGETKMTELAGSMPADSKYLFPAFIEVNNGALTERASQSQSK